MSSESPLILEVVSDTICPWCYVGKRRLERALALPGVPPVQVAWKPFELNPGMPPGGMDRREYRSRKFGSWEHSLALDAQVTRAGAEVGIAFRFEKIERTPNTLASHKLLRLAGQYGRQDTVAETLFDAYFTQGLDIGDPAILVRLGQQAGLPAAAIEAVLADDDVTRSIRDEEAHNHTRNLSGVPAFLLSDRLLASGAQHEDFLADTLRRAAPDHRAADAQACGLDGECA